MRTGGVAAVVGLLAVVAGCTPAEVVPVPTSASAPFVCDGVPAQAVELVLGVPIEDVDVKYRDPWDAAVFDCAVSAGPGENDPTVWVTRGPVSLGPFGDADAAKEEFAQAQAPDRYLEVPGVDGAGMSYRYGETGVMAVWECGDVYLNVFLARVTESGRDAIDDAANLVVSMLPWTCGGQEVPLASR